MREPMEFDNAMTNYEDTMDIAEEKRRGLIRHCSACLRAWTACRCDLFCLHCFTISNHTTAQHEEAAREQAWTVLLARLLGGLEQRGWTAERVDE
jgi:hypothetical protein